MVYIDPNSIPDQSEIADYIIITHDHLPHFRASAINMVSDINTTLISHPFIIGRDYTPFPGYSLQFSNISFEFVYMYNIDKFRPSGVLFHPMGSGVGVIVDFGEVRVYHAGDTDAIPEMRNINTDIVLLPVSGYAWMTAMEAVTAVEYLKESSNLKYAIQIHYGDNGFNELKGSLQDAITFGRNARCTVVILNSISTT